MSRSARVAVVDEYVVHVIAVSQNTGSAIGCHEPPVSRNRQSERRIVVLVAGRVDRNTLDPNRSQRTSNLPFELQAKCVAEVHVAQNLTRAWRHRMRNHVGKRLVVVGWHDFDDGVLPACRKPRELVTAVRVSNGRDLAGIQLLIAIGIQKDGHGLRARLAEVEHVVLVRVVPNRALDRWVGKLRGQDMLDAEELLDARGCALVHVVLHGRRVSGQVECIRSFATVDEVGHDQTVFGDGEEVVATACQDRAIRGTDAVSERIRDGDAAAGKLDIQVDRHGLQVERVGVRV